MRKNFMNKCAVLMAFASLFGIKTSAMNTNKNGAKSPQSLGAVGGEEQTKKTDWGKIAKIVGLSAGILGVLEAIHSIIGAATDSKLGRYSIGRLIRNRVKKNDQPGDPGEQDDKDRKKNQNPDVRDGQGDKNKKKNNKSNVDSGKQQKNEKSNTQGSQDNIEQNNIKQHNMNLLDDAIVKAQRENRLHADGKAMKNAILSVFSKIVLNFVPNDRSRPLHEVCNNTRKIVKVSIEEIYGGGSNYVALYCASGETDHYVLRWCEELGKRCVCVEHWSYNEKYNNNNCVNLYKISYEDVLVTFK